VRSKDVFRSWPTEGEISITGTEGETTATSPQGGIAISELQSAVSTPLEPIKTRMHELGLLVANDQAFLARCIPALVVLAVLVVFWLGLINGWVHVSREKGWGVWFWRLTEIAFWVPLGLFVVPPHRSQRGDKVLEQLQAKHAVLQARLESEPGAIPGAELSLAVALFGLTCVATGPLADLKTALLPPSGAGGGYSGDTGDYSDGDGGDFGCSE